MAYKDIGEEVEYKILLGGSVHTNSCPDIEYEDDVVVFNSSDGEHYFGMTEKLLSKHLLLIGGIGCGKTNTFNIILHQLMQRMKGPQGGEDIMFIFDTKGDFKNMFFENDNPRHAVLGNGDLYRPITKYWNIYKELLVNDKYHPEDSNMAAKELAAQLFKGTAGDTNKFFETTAADIFALVLIDTMRRSSGYGYEQTPENQRIIRRAHDMELNNEALLAFFQNATIDDYHDMIDRNPDFTNLRSYLGQRGAALDGQNMGILAQISTVVNSLFVGIFGKKPPNPADKGISIREAVRRKEGRVLFVEYDLSIGEKLGPIYRTLFDLALKEALGRSESVKGNVYFIIDEFKLLPNLNYIDDGLNFGRSLGVKVFAGIQNVHQIYDIYGEERGKALFAGFMNCFCFQTPDPETRKFASQRTGENYGTFDYHVLERPQIVTREGHTAEDWDLANLRIGEACVDIVGVSPFLFRFKEFVN